MLVTAEEDGGKYKVFFEDTDISKVCVRANDTEGWADVLVSLGENKLLVSESVPVKARIEGRISIVEISITPRPSNQFLVDSEGRVLLIPDLPQIFHSI